MSAASVTSLTLRSRTISLTACVRCGRVQLDGRWLSESEAVRLLRSFDDPAPPSFTATTCVTCRARVERRRGRGRTGDSGAGLNRLRAAA